MPNHLHEAGLQKFAISPHKFCFQLILYETVHEKKNHVEKSHIAKLFFSLTPITLEFVLVRSLSPVTTIEDIRKFVWANVAKIFSYQTPRHRPLPKVGTVFFTIDF